MLALGGFFVTGSANGINQIIEKDFDKLMHRTANRPLATNRISKLEAAIFCTLLGLIGVALIGFYLNKTSSILALASLLSYAFIYTPLKRISPISVLVGAFPGAVPAMLGWVAFTGTIGIEALVFFGIQFFWQFPHFWSVAWLLDDDYKRAGFKMLPSTPGRDKGTALQTLAFTLVLIPFGMLPAYLGFAGIISTIIAVSGCIWMSYNAYLLFKSCDIASAKRLMFSAFIYLPLVQLAFWLDKI
jgi:protoheme IX farnesyltransferase